MPSILLLIYIAILNWESTIVLIFSPCLWMPMFPDTEVIVYVFISNLSTCVLYLPGLLCRNYQEVRIQEQVHRLQTGCVPRSICETLENDLVDTCRPGDDVTITYGYVWPYYVNYAVINIYYDIIYLLHFIM